MNEIRSEYNEDNWELNELTIHLKDFLKISKNLDIDEITNIAGDLSIVARTAQSVMKLFNQKKFESFLEGISEEDTPTTEQIKKLRKYIDSESKAQFIANSLTKVLMSNSTIASTIIGSMIKKIINEQQILSHEHLICINALGDLFDKDIENIVLFESHLKESQRKNSKIKYFYYYSLKKYCEKNNLDYLSTVLTVDKCVTLQLLNRNFESYVDASIDGENDTFDLHSSEINEYFGFTNPGLLLLDYIKRVKQ